MWTVLWENLALSVVGMENGTQNLIKGTFDGHVFLIPLRMRWISIWHEHVACYVECQPLTRPPRPSLPHKKKLGEGFRLTLRVNHYRKFQKWLQWLNKVTMWKLIEVMATDQFDSESSRQTYLNQSPKFSGLNSLNAKKNLNQKFTEIYLGFDGNMRLHVNRDFWKYCVVG